MANHIKIRWKWLKFMYGYTIVGAGGFGLGIIFIPEIMKSIFEWPHGDPDCFWRYGQRLFVIWDAVYFGSQISSQICAGSHASVKLQGNLVYRRHPAAFDFRKISNIRGFACLNIRKLYHR